MNRTFQEFIEVSLSDIMRAYGIGAMTIDIDYKKKSKYEGNSKICLLDITVLAHYKKATISVYKEVEELFEEGQYDKILHALTHEIGHILTDKLMCLAFERHATNNQIIDADEELTEHIALILEKSLKDTYQQIINKYAPKKSSSTKKGAKRTK